MIFAYSKMALFISLSLFLPLSKRQRNYSRRSSLVDRNCGTGGVGYLITGLDTESLLMSKHTDETTPV